MIGSSANKISILLQIKFPGKKAFVTQRHVLHDCYEYGQMNEYSSAIQSILNQAVIGFPEKATFSG